VASGTASSDGQQLNLKLDGTAPMALADQFIAPRRAGGTASYDLRVSGPAQLSSVSGTIILGDGGISLPNLRMSLDKLAGNVQLSAGQARIALRGVSSTGGSFNATGPVSLSAPYQADLALAYTDIGAREPGVFDTTLSGQLRLAGPLLGAASLTGTIDLGRVEMRIADGHSVAIGSLPGLKHVNEPAAVKRTRTYAGLIDTSANASNLPVFTLDILVRAPGRIFIRGRGLDAELGGQLRLAGTTKMQIPQGRFDLVRGRLDLLGRRLDLSQGYVTIRGDSDAYMNLIAESQVDTTLAQVLVEGLVSDPQISFSSVPDLPEDEVLSLLLFGRGLGKVSPLQAVQLATAIATLAGKGGDGIINKLRKRFGLDDLDVSTTEDGTTKARVGKYISDKAYADATVDSAGKAEIKLNIILSPNVTAKGRLGSDGSTGLGVYFEKDY